MSKKILKTEPIKKRMGAPFKEVKRDVVHSFKITSNESLKLNEMALNKGIRVSEFIRKKLFNS